MYQSKINKVAIFATFLAVVVVMLGAWTRLVDAGLGCPDWPGCYGFLTVPTTEDKIAIAEARFPDTPFEMEKAWPEMIHRHFAKALGFTLLCLSFYVLVARRRSALSEDRIPVGHIWGLLALVICQGLFGMWTVTLKLWPQVVTAHLLGGFATLSLLFLLFLRTSKRLPLDVPAQIRARLPALQSAALVGLLLVVGQIFLGAWTASNYAALACGNELPGCQGSLWPEMDFAQAFNLSQTVGPNYLGGLLDNESRVAIQVAHRIGALVLTAYLLWLAFRLWSLKAVPAIKAATVMMVVVFFAQLILGLSNVIFLVPLNIAIAHNAVGALLLLSMVNLLYHLHRMRQ
jgi:cytochrome c oxidase assembly protein subunit 15